MTELLWVGFIIACAMAIYFTVITQEGKIRPVYGWVGGLGSFTLALIFATLLSITGL